jgi:hypothetical protein
MGPSETQDQEGAVTTLADQSGETQADGASQQDGPSGGERTFTAAEMAEVRADRDRERGESRQLLAQAALNRDVERAERVEQQAQETDRRRVADGDFTAAEADSRSQGRIRDAGDSIRVKVERGQENASIQQVRAETNEMAKLLKTQEAAKNNNVDLGELVKWVEEKNPGHPDQIDLQAERMALAREKAALKGTDTFDSNRSTTRGVSMDNMSPLEKIAKGVGNL